MEFRKILFLIIFVFILLLFFSDCSKLSSAEKESVNTPDDVKIAAPVSSESFESKGDSIFNETMVDMTWQEVEKAAQNGAIILLPTAVIEEHGPHMSCGVDTYLAYQTCKLTRRALESRGIQTLIAPPLYWGRNRTTHVFPGTFTVREETIKALISDILLSLKSWGFSEVFNINWHYDGAHLAALMKTIIHARESLDVNAYFVMPDYDVARFRLKGDEPFLLVHKTPPLKEEPQDYLDLHAGAGETGLMAAYFPGQVDLDLTKKLEPTKVTIREVGKWVTDAKAVTPLGYLGDPASFNIEESKKFLEAYCLMIADAIESYLGKE
jgi:creatinine amidohydrolase